MRHFAEVVLQAAYAQVDGGRTELLYIACMNQVSFKLIYGAVFRAFVEVEHQAAYATQVVLAGSPCIIGQCHMVVHPLEGLIQVAYARGLPCPFLVIITNVFIE